MFLLTDFKSMVCDLSELIKVILNIYFDVYYFLLNQCVACGSSCFFVFVLLFVIYGIKLED
mgnify:CR=1 FL=1